MITIKLQPSEKGSDGFYTLHDGYQFVKFTNKRKYLKSFTAHKRFLQTLADAKYLHVIKLLMDKELDAAMIELEKLKQVQHYCLYGATRVYFINKILIPNDEF